MQPVFPLPVCPPPVAFSSMEKMTGRRYPRASWATAFLCHLDRNNSGQLPRLLALDCYSYRVCLVFFSHAILSPFHCERSESFSIRGSQK